ncbi:MAG: trypsin-like peptidase domain-containing protein [Candidatus Bathyarchaeota archaeon]|nr:trypsin-like peptidase domain-containing protein [Candidatus Bathyarchaeota archaeon]
MKKSNFQKASTSLFVLLFVAGLLVGGLASIYITFQEITELEDKVNFLQSQIIGQNGLSNVTFQNITIYQNSSSLVELYENVRESIVLVQGITSEGGVQGSGFVYFYLNRDIVITNYHVVHETSSLSVTFSNGNGYEATVIGIDPYVDLAILSVDAPNSEFRSIEIVSSSSLRVGEMAIAIGNPFGLVGSLTTGVVSALGRTLAEEYAGGFSIPNIIQTSTPINPGNSGGPLLNAVGNVIGITTAIAVESQGLGFAIPSDTILRELTALIDTGTYSAHSYLGVSGQDMSYNLAQEIGSSITYGWRIDSVIAGGPSEGIVRINDIIIELNGIRIRNNDELASYLSDKTLPGETLILTVLRDESIIELSLILGTRPPPPI